MRSGRWAEAEQRIAQLPARERSRWERRLLEARLLKDHQALASTADPSALAAFLQTHARAMRACIRPDIFHETARRLAADGDPHRAADVHRALLECPLPRTCGSAS